MLHQLQELLGLHEETPEDREAYERFKQEEQAKHPRVLPAAQARQTYTIIRKRSRPTDIFDYFALGINMLLDKIYDIFGKQ